jgi:hypothetical protein
MRTQVGLRATALVMAAVAATLFPAVSPRQSRSEESTGLNESTLTSIKLRLREIGASESTRGDKLVRVTREPFPLAPQLQWPCAPVWQARSEWRDPHEGKAIHVFVTSQGYDTMKSGKGLYPEGTVILKEKFADADGKQPVLFTGMLKRKKGYNPEAGDWQFFVLNSNATKFETRGMRRCANCHEPFHDTDFVSRNYVTAKAVVTGVEANDGSSRLTQLKGNSAVTEEMLASIRLGIRQANAPNAARDRTLVRVTKEPYHVITQSSFPLCLVNVRVGERPAPGDRSAPIDPHEGHWIHVYVSHPGRDAMLTGKGVYPRGAVILKQKFRDAAGKETELFTGMLKREKGYNPAAGDWEFFALNAGATAVLPLKDFKSCVGCHEPFRATDFVSRKYLSAQTATSGEARRLNERDRRP